MAFLILLGGAFLPSKSTKIDGLHIVDPPRFLLICSPPPESPSVGRGYVRNSDIPLEPEWGLNDD